MPEKENSYRNETLEEQQQYAEATRESVKATMTAVRQQLNPTQSSHQHQHPQQQQQSRAMSSSQQGQRMTQIDIYEDPYSDDEGQPSLSQQQQTRQAKNHRASDPQQRRNKATDLEPPGAPNVLEKKRLLAQQDETLPSNKRARDSHAVTAAAAATTATQASSRHQQSHDTNNHHRQQQQQQQDEEQQQRQLQQYQRRQQQREQQLQQYRRQQQILQQQQQRQQQQQQPQQPQQPVPGHEQVQGQVDFDVVENPPRMCVIRYRSGKVHEQTHVTLVHTDGSKTYLDGRIFMPEGCFAHTDGTVIRTWATLQGQVFHEVSAPSSVGIRTWLSKDGRMHHDVLPPKDQNATATTTAGASTSTTNTEGTGTAASASSSSSSSNPPPVPHERRTVRFIVEQGMRRHLSDQSIYMKLLEQIEYGSYYEDDIYTYRHVILPKALLHRANRAFFDQRKPHLLRLLREEEWRALGLTMSRGWENYMRHEPEPHVMLFRRRKNFDQEPPVETPAPTVPASPTQQYQEELPSPVPTRN
ncbi:hypothetical protein BGW41_000406 [Actinomortierella wolfii]|nr:hypothetical protein BGW41_000406 [Actinomortierella wolfii]